MKRIEKPATSATGSPVSVTDPLRRYLTEASRTPLLGPEKERVLARRMARRRDLFLRTAASVPEAWLPMVGLVRRALVGDPKPSSIFALGGVSESAFHRHLAAAADAARRLDPIGTRLMRPSALPRDVRVALLREGRSLAHSMNLRMGPLRDLLEEAKRGPLPCGGDEAIEAAHRLFGAFVETRNELVRANLRLVVHVAKRVARRPTQMLDLVQEGNHGLLYAAEKYDPNEAAQFHSYAYWWIRQSMSRSLVAPMRTSAAGLDLSAASEEVRRTVHEFRLRRGRDPSIAELEAIAGLSREQATRLARVPIRELSIDQSDDEDDGRSLFESLADAHSEENPDSGWIRSELWSVLDSLSPREREIIALRYGLGNREEATLEQLSEKLCLSRERVRQIELGALEKLRRPDRAQRLRDVLEAAEE